MSMSRFIHILPLIFGFMLAACNAHEAERSAVEPVFAPVISDHAMESDVIRSGDVIDIVIEGEADLTGSYTVNKSGAIAMPLIGMIDVAGLMPEDAAKLIEKRYSSGYLKAPKVRIAPLEASSFFVMGAVRSQGSYTWRRDMAISSVGELSGGYLDTADLKEAHVIRDGVPIPFKEGLMIMPADVIVIPERELP